MKKVKMKTSLGEIEFTLKNTMNLSDAIEILNDLKSYNDDQLFACIGDTRKHALELAITSMEILINMGVKLI